MLNYIFINRIIYLKYIYLLIQLQRDLAGIIQKLNLSLLSYLSKYLVIYFFDNQFVRKMFGRKQQSAKEQSLISQISQAQKAMKTIKYPVRPISNAIILKKKLSQLKQPINSKLSSKINQKINAYRQVRGDGNCFFRAFAFSYISNTKLVDHDQLFTHLNDISLDVCKIQSIPKQFRPYYKDQILKGVIKYCWKKQYNSFVKASADRSYIVNYKRALANMLVQNPYLDFILILYFRAVCLYAFGKMKQNFKQFLKGTQQEEITTYGEQSQGLILDLMNKVFQINIFIYQIRKTQVVSYQYQKNKQSNIGNNNIYLLFYDNHYDLLQINNDPLSQYEDQKIQEQYFADSSEIYIQGICIQCNKKVDVSSETSLCLDCFNKSMANLNTFKKDRMVEGQCTQCNRYKKNISQQLQMCEACIDLIQYSSNSRLLSYPVPQSNTIKNRLRNNTATCRQCRQVKSTSQIDENNKVCYTCMFGKQQATPSVTKSKLNQNPDKSSINQLESTGSSHITTLDNKLQSQIGKRKRQQQQQKGNMMRGKIFQRTKPIQYQCNKCRNDFESQVQIQKCKQICSNCKEQLKKGSDNSKIEKSGIKNTMKSFARCKKCRQYFQTQKELYQIQSICQHCLKIEQSNNAQISTSKPSSTKSSMHTGIKTNYYICKLCQNAFQSQIILPEPQRICKYCFVKQQKNHIQAGQKSIVMKSKIKTDQKRCKNCHKEEDKFYKMTDGYCTPCLNIIKRSGLRPKIR